MHELEKGRGRGGRAEWALGVLRRCEPFTVLGDTALAPLVEASVPNRFPRHAVLYAQGAAAERLYVVAVGRVRVVRSAGETRLLTVAYRSAGELLGETCLPDSPAYRGTASATEVVEALSLPTEHVRALLAEYPNFAQRIMALMVARRLEAERRVESLLSRGVESRVAGFLLDAAERNGLPDERGILISVRYTHQEIADYVGSTRETVTLTLGELRKQELVRFDHRRIVLTNVGELMKLL